MSPADWSDILIDLSGGPRPFAREGFPLEEQTNWRRTGILSAYRLASNVDKVYALGPLSDVPSDKFNATAIRIRPDEGLLETFVEGNETTGDVRIPLLTMHTTGDWQVPVIEQQVLRRKVEAAGKGDLLVQRMVQDPAHCGFTNAEWETGLEDLVAWVERGETPEGDDVLVDDLSNIGGRFTLAPRFGTAAAEKAPGADERVTIRGKLTLDGELLDGYLLDVVVRKDGLSRSCAFPAYLPVSDGRYEVAAAGDGEARGCGAPGATVFLTAYANDQFLVSQETADWPAEGEELNLDASFSSTDPTGVGRPSTALWGSVFGPGGDPPPPGTVIQAYVGDTLCGVTSLPHVVMGFTDPSTYRMFVVGPASVAACEEGATIEFRVGGEPIAETAVNDFASDGHELDLTVP